MKKKYTKPVIESKEEFERIALQCSSVANRNKTTCQKSASQANCPNASIISS